MKLIRNNIVLLMLLLGLAQRIVNPFYGSPELYVVGDEAASHIDTLYMLQNKTIVSMYSQYPPLNSYVQIPFLLVSFIYKYIAEGYKTLGGLKLFVLTHEGYFLFVPRLVAAFFGTATLLVIYQTTRLYFPKQKYARYLALMLAANSLLLIEISHFGRPWSGGVFFFALSIYCLIMGFTNKSVRTAKYFIVSAVCIGITYGFLPLGIFGLLLFIFLILVVYDFKIVTIVRNKVFLISLLIIVSLMYLFSQMTLFRPGVEFFTIIPDSSNLYTAVIHIISNNNSWSFFYKLISAEPVITTLVILAILFIREYSKIVKGLYLYSLVYFILTSLFLYGAARYLTPLVVIWSPIAGFVLSKLLVKRGKFSLLLLLVIFIISIIPGLLWNRAFSQKPTFILAREYIEKNIPSDIPVAATSFRDVGFTPSLSAIAITQDKDPDYYRSLSQLLAGETYPDNNRNILYLEKLVNLHDDNEVSEFISKQKVRYILDLYYDPDKRIVNKLSAFGPEVVAHYSPYRNDQEKFILDKNQENLTDVSLMQLYRIQRGGPYVDIIQITSHD